MKIDKIINENLNTILIIMASVLGVLIIAFVFLAASLGKMKKKYKKMMRGNDNKNLEEVITLYMKEIKTVKMENEKVVKLVEDINSKVEKSITKVAIRRYRAFEDVGSDLSFSLAMLDDMNNGVIITSLYGRVESIVYGKPIESGISRYELSIEEKQVLEIAIKN